MLVRMVPVEPRFSLCHPSMQPIPVINLEMLYGADGGIIESDDAASLVIELDPGVDGDNAAITATISADDAIVDRHILIRT